MKKISFLIMMTFVVNFNVIAQNLTQQMCQLHKGHVKTLTQRIEGQPGEGITRFDKDGKVLSFEQANVKMEYSWNSDNRSVEIKGYQDGIFQGSQMLYISEWSSSRLVYETGGVSLTTDFKKNGAISKQTMSANGQTQTSYLYYKRPDDFLPYKTVTSSGGQSMTINIELLSTDSFGNPTKYSQTVNGQTIITYCDITYYNEQ